MSAALCACGSPSPQATQNPTFYLQSPLGQQGEAVLGDRYGAFEHEYPPLDLARADQRFVGVSVLGGTLHFARPPDWTIRRASNSPGTRYIEYVSPRQVVFALRERVDSPTEPWREILRRYQAEAARPGLRLSNRPVPAVVGNAQARWYDVRRSIASNEEEQNPYVIFSREYLLRSEQRVVLVQIVYTDETLEGVQQELAYPLRSVQLE